MGFAFGFRDLSSNIFTRAYLHSAGINEYGANKTKQLASAMKYLGDAKNSNSFKEISEREKLEYILAALWADEETKIIDIFGFGDLTDKWSGNPDVQSWDFRNGIFTRGARTCGDTLVMLGKEEEHRRTTKNLVDYFKSPLVY